MNKEAKKARAAYQRQWAKSNPEKIKTYMQRYWNKKAAEAKQAEATEPNNSAMKGDQL